MVSQGTGRSQEINRMLSRASSAEPQREVEGFVQPGPHGVAGSGHKSGTQRSLVQIQPPQTYLPAEVLANDRRPPLRERCSTCPPAGGFDNGAGWCIMV